MLQVGEAAGLFGFRADELEDMPAGCGLVVDHAADTNCLHRQPSSRHHPSPLDNRLPAEQSQLLALGLDQIDVLMH